jgi:Inosine-uridine nucleoside N-ribohydrolase
MKVTYDESNYGRTVGDKDRLNEPTTNVKVAVNVDKQRYLDTFMNYLTQLFKQH